MARIPVKFKRVAAAFDEVARVRLCESSGTEHSPADSLSNLSDLVNSFLERDDVKGEDDSDGFDDQEGSHRKHDIVSETADFETNRDILRGLLLGCDNDVMKHIHAVAEKAYRESSERLPLGFKRRLMTKLRREGLDAGLCKSKWEKIGKCPSGEYEYVDVNHSGSRYIVEAFLAEEFRIARPTSHYTSLLDGFPPIFVGKVEELKEIAKIMSNAIRKSLRSNDMNIPPWRRHAYMKAKWLSPYRRTINEFPGQEGSRVPAWKKSIGFSAAAQVVS